MAARKKAMKKCTLKEFRAWLEGIEEIQPDSWSPDATQWNMIRQKIGSIELEVVEKVIEKRVNVPVHGAPLPPAAGLAPVITPPANPAFTPPDDGWTAPTPPAQPTGSAIPEMTEAAKEALSGKLPTEMIRDIGGKSTTPNIDTSKQPYNSNFGG